ncbi:S-layer homology domain-containing protein [Rossellomorea aquimaris]|uniref:S-layer homology domain-containing protein n=1 Tax=Rossellomorea aquimaris TaxID=189382 RepID=UPI0037CC8DFA
MAYKSKSYRKFLATGTTAALVASAIAPAASAADHPFTDVNSNYGEAVSYLYSNDIVNGTTETTFGTTASLTRGDAAVILANALNLDTSNAPDAGFVDTNSRVAGSVNALKAAGIIDGKSETQFGPTDQLTRGAMAKILVNAYDFTKYAEETPFTDLTATFDEYIEALYGAGITSGKNDTMYGTNDEITRGEFAKLLFKSIKFEAPEVNPMVESFEGLNAKEVVVTFNVEVDKTEAEKVSNYKLGVNSPSKVVLAEDKKSATLTFASTEVTNEVAVVEALPTVADKDVKTAKFTKVFSYNDAVRPSATGLTYPSNTMAKVSFSEPVNLGGDALSKYVTVTDSDGVAVSNADLGLALAADGKSFTFSTAKFKKDETYSVTIIGLKDFSNNLISPNPMVLTAVKTEVDGVDPKVTSLTSDDTNQFTVKFDEAIDTNLATYFKYTVDGGSEVAVTSANATVSKDMTEVTVDLGTKLSSGPHTIKVLGYQDLSENDGEAYSALINFQADTTKPAVASTSVETVNNKRVIAVKLSEEVTLTAKDLTYSYIKDGVLVSGKTLDSSKLSLTDLNEDGVKQTVLIDTTGLETGEYTISLPTGLVADKSSNMNINAATTVKATLGDFSGSDTVKPGVSSITVDDAAETVTVVFSEKVSNETALNLANYTVEGNQVFEKAVFIGDKTTVRLSVKSGSVKLTGDYLFEIMNVKDLSGNAMKTYSTTQEFVENVAPNLVSAKLTSNDTITLTFSEAMNTASIEEVTAEADFDVFIDGTKESGVVEASKDSKTFTLKLSDALTSSEFSSAITIKPATTFDVEDSNGNMHPTFSSVTVAK